MAILSSMHNKRDYNSAVAVILVSKIRSIP